MRTLMVGYDLSAPGRNYDDLHDYLKGFGTWWHHLDSTWLIVTNLSPVQVRDGVKARVDSNDEVLVIDVHTGNWASYGFTQKATAWLQEQLARRAA